MKYITDNTTEMGNAPAPLLKKNTLLLATKITLISPGTERMLINFGKSSYFQKMRQQPEKVKMVFEKIKTDGLFTTIDAVRSKLAQPLLLGYCNVGVVVESGSKTHRFKLGDRVVSNGLHADIVNVPHNLCALIPHNVDDETAAFTVMASIGLQGIRLAQPTLGENFVVIGAGLIGLLTIQLLRANGCRVLAIDFDPHKLELANSFGAEVCYLNHGEDPIATGMAFSNGYGVDGVIITASTKSDDPVTQAAKMSRKRGRIVLVGVTGLALNRADFYEKELSFQVSCSYGPGRYEPNYEGKGLDYPIGFVRWTEQRNFEAILQMMATGKLNVKPLITHRVRFDEAPQAYQLLMEDKSALGILLQYPSNFTERPIKEVQLQEKKSFDPLRPILGVVGAGNYAARVLLPAFNRAEAQLHTLVTSGGINGVIHGKKLGFHKASTDMEAMLAEREINTVTIATQHNTHAALVVKALNAGKHVFVEKPLALDLEQLSEIEATYHAATITGKRLHLMVGFNRRFSPLSQKMKALLNEIRAPKVLIITVNAGFIPQDHWTQDEEIGGGRILGEACHFIDLMRFLTGYEITSVQAKKIGEQYTREITEDKAIITLRFSDGSLGTIHYLANGAASFPKERVEVFTAGRILQLDNFRRLKGFDWPGFKKMSLWRQDKGQNDCCMAFLKAIAQGHETPIPFNEVIETARITIEAVKLLRNQSE